MSRFLGFEIDFRFAVKRVKRVYFSIPDWADDAHLRQGGRIGNWGTPDGKTKVCYYKGNTAYFIDVPECKESVEVSVTPMYNLRNRTIDGFKYNTNRQIVVDLYF